MSKIFNSIDMKKIYLLTLAVCSYSLFSCNSDEILSEDNNNDVVSPTTKSIVLAPDTIELKFIYQGQQYVSTALEYETHIEIQNPEVKQVYDKLQSLESTSALVRHDGFIEYFDNESILAENLEGRINNTPTPNPRWIGFNDGNGDPQDDWENNPLNYLARAWLYDDTNYEDRSCKLFLSKTTDRYDIEGLKSFDNFNDKCSSVKIQYYYGDPASISLLVVYEDAHYKGHSFYFFADYYDKEFVYASLKALFYDSKPKPAPRKDSWNDRISSCKFYICRKDQLPEVG